MSEYEILAPISKDLALTASYTLKSPQKISASEYRKSRLLSVRLPELEERGSVSRTLE